MNVDSNACSSSCLLLPAASHRQPKNGSSAHPGQANRPCCSIESSGPNTFLRILRTPPAVSATTVSRPDHRQDARPDGFWQLWPSFNHSRQVVIGGGRQKSPSARRLRRIPRRFRREPLYSPRFAHMFESCPLRSRIQCISEEPWLASVHTNAFASLAFFHASPPCCRGIPLAVSVFLAQRVFLTQRGPANTDAAPLFSRQQVEASTTI